MGGDFEECLVADDAIPGNVAALRFPFPPRRDFPQDRKMPPAVAAGLEAAPSLVRVHAIGFGIGQHRHFLDQPFGSPVPFQAARQIVVNRPQMDHVGQGVFDLPRAQGPVRPIGEAGGFVDLRFGDLGDKRLVGRRFAEAADHGGDLGIENGGGNFARHVMENLDVLPRGVKDLENVAIGHQLENRIEIDAGRQSIDRRSALRPADLQQAEIRPEAAFADEFRVDGYISGGGETPAEGRNRAVFSQQSHRRPYTRNYHPGKARIGSNSACVLGPPPSPAP